MPHNKHDVSTTEIVLTFLYSPYTQSVTEHPSKGKYLKSQAQTMSNCPLQVYYSYYREKKSFGLLLYD